MQLTWEGQKFFLHLGQDFHFFDQKWVFWHPFMQHDLRLQLITCWRFACGSQAILLPDASSDASSSCSSSSKVFPLSSSGLLFFSSSWTISTLTLFTVDIMRWNLSCFSCLIMFNNLKSFFTRRPWWTSRQPEECSWQRARMISGFHGYNPTSLNVFFRTSHSNASVSAW